MRANVQPIVAYGQQLIVARCSATLQPMVAKSRDDAKRLFSKNLNLALDRVGFVRDRERIGALSKLIEVTYEAARKWLGGWSIPDQTNMLLICERCKIDIMELRTDFDRENRAFGNDAFSRKLSGMWEALDDDVRGQIVAFALINATTKPAPKKDDSRDSQTGS